MVKSRSAKRNAKNVRGLGRDRHFSLALAQAVIYRVNNSIVRLTKLDQDGKSIPREPYKMLN